MENCFVKKLKASVNDDNLHKLGILRVVVGAVGSETDNNSYVRVYNSDAASKASVESGNVAFYTSMESTEGVSEFTIPRNTYTRYVKGTSGVFELDKKYNITNIELGNRFSIDVKELNSISGISKLVAYGHGDIANLASCIGAMTYIHLSSDGEPVYGKLSFSGSTHFTVFDFTNTDAEFNINTLSDNTGLTQLKAAHCSNVNGNITTALGNKVSITTIEAYGTKISGDLKEFALAQIAAGRTSCEQLKFPAVGLCPNITTGSVVISDARSGGYLHWTNSSNISYMDGSGVDHLL